MVFHAVTMLLLAWLIKAPLFLLAVGSQANVGGSSFCSRGCFCFPSSTSSSWCAAGSARLCSRNLWWLVKWTTNARRGSRFRRMM
jgi:hypothetical protein